MFNYFEHYTTFEILQNIMSFIPYTTNVINTQYGTQNPPEYYFYCENKAQFIFFFVNIFCISNTIPKCVDYIYTSVINVTHISNGLSIVEVQHEDITTTSDSVLFYP